MRHTTRIAIVGGGLSGLYAAFLLEQCGVSDYLLFEARETIGGRIVSVLPEVPHDLRGDEGEQEINRFDLGPSWFWPGYQTQLDQLTDQLGLARFPQFEQGDMVVERSLHAAPARMRGYESAPPSMRLFGGMAALTAALRRRLDTTRILTGHRVLSLHASTSHVALDTLAAGGEVMTWHASKVLLAVPPRLAEAGIEFSPALPQAVSLRWRTTPTWMAPHAKYLAVYDEPFWREQGLSGEARSACGPMVEIHDASIPGGSAALFGFIGVPAPTRQRVPDTELRTLCRAQLTRLFGPRAAHPHAEFIKDWAQDPYTATADDMAVADHPLDAPAASLDSGLWQGRIVGIASEWSPRFPGYVAGAIEAASLGVQAVSGDSVRDVTTSARNTTFGD